MIIQKYKIKWYVFPVQRITATVSGTDFSADVPLCCVPSQHQGSSQQLEESGSFSSLHSFSIKSSYSQRILLLRGGWGS